MKCNINDFDIERFKTGNYAIHCNTEEKAKELLNYLDEEHCISWGLGTNIKDTGWKTFRGKTCYSYNISNGTLGFCNYQYYKENGIIIYEFESQYPLTWKDFINGEFAIHCKRESEVNELLQWIYKFNEEDEIVNSPLAILGEGWSDYEDESCYYVKNKRISYDGKSNYDNCDNIVLEWNNKYEYHIDGVIESELSEDEFNDKFIDWVESIGASFGGGVVPC